MDKEEASLPEHNQTNTIMGLLWMLIAIFLVGFIASDFFKENILSKNIPALLTNSIVGIGFLTWLKEDAKKQKYRLSKVTKFFAVVLPQITIFVYCYTSRGFKKGSTQAIKATGFILLCLVVLFVTTLLFDH